MKKIYFAGPLFSQAEKDYNEKLCALLENKGYIAFLPQRDGINAAFVQDKTEAEKIDIIFEKDVSEIKKCDVFFMVLDGRVPDDGACTELGIAYTLGKKCYGIKTDVRALEKDLDLNPLICGCFSKIFRDDEKSAIENLTEYLEKNEL